MLIGDGWHHENLEQGLLSFGLILFVSPYLVEFKVSSDKQEFCIFKAGASKSPLIAGKHGSIYESR